MRAAEARLLGSQIAAALRAGKRRSARRALAPLIEARTRFVVLDLVGAALAQAPDPQLTPFLDRVAASATMGGWIVIAAALRAKLDADADLAVQIERARVYARRAAVWHAVDAIGERVVGGALVLDLDTALDAVRSWRGDASPWVRRCLGAGVHNWAKRSRGRDPAAADRLLDLLEPLFEERDTNAVKGVGWALKTLGRHYPQIVAPRLARMISSRPRHRALMRRKAAAYLPHLEAIR